MIRKAGGRAKYLAHHRAIAAKGGSNHNPESASDFRNVGKRRVKALAAKGGKASKRPPVNATEDEPAEVRKPRLGIENNQPTRRGTV